MNEKKPIKATKTPKVGKYPCPFCEAVCLNPQSLKSHIDWKHKRDKLEAAIEAEKQPTSDNTEPVETKEQKPATATEVPEKVAAVKEKTPVLTKKPAPVAEPPGGGFDVSMVDPLVRESEFAKEIKAEVGGIKNDVKYMATAITGMAAQMKEHNALFQQLDGYLKQLQAGTPNPEVTNSEVENPEVVAEETPNPEAVAEKTPNPATVVKETPSPEAATKESLSPEVAAAIAAELQAQTSIPAGGSVIGSSFIPIIESLAKVMEIAKGTPAATTPQDNFVKQFLDATTLVSTMRKATIDEMQTMFTSMATFFKQAPKFMGAGETEKAAPEAAKPIVHLEG